MTLTLKYFTCGISLILPLAASGQAVDAFIAEALEKNPGLRAARLRWEAKLEEPAIAGALPDPMVSYGYFFQNVETRVGPQNQKVGVSQKIPFPGKLSTARNRAWKEALVAMWEYQTQIREVVLRVRLLYYDLYRIDRSTGILREQADVLETITETSQQSYEAGRSELQDVLKSKLARNDIESRLLALAQQRAAVVARLNALRGRAQETAVPTVEEISLPPLPSQDLLTKIATQYRQELQLAGVAIERDALALALARKDRLPDITVGVDVTQVNDAVFSNPPDSGQDAVFGFISINLPIWSGKLKAQERQAHKQLEASRETAANVLLQTRADVRDAWFQAGTYIDQIALYRTSLIPQAEDTYEASLTSYTSAKATLIDLLDSERSLLSARLGLVLNRAQLGKAIATLERAVGVDLSDVQKTPTKK